MGWLLLTRVNETPKQSAPERPAEKGGLLSSSTPWKDTANAMEVDARDTGEQQIIRVVPLVG
jgi:hypothetical protein